MFNIGFTGNSEEMTLEQTKMLEKKVRMLKRRGANVMHHGCNPGCDEDVHEYVKGTLGMVTVGHPPMEGLPRGVEKEDVDYERVAIENDARNEEIVFESEVLFACPLGKEEDYSDSDAWQCIRHAKNKGIRILIYYPDGEVEGVEPTLHNPKWLRT